MSPAQERQISGRQTNGQRKLVEIGVGNNDLLTVITDHPSNPIHSRYRGATVVSRVGSSDYG